MAAAAVGRILGTIANIAGFIGAEKIVEWVENVKASGKNLSQDAILAQFQAKLGDLKRGSQALYDQLMLELNAAPSVANFINPKAISGIQDKKKEIRNKLAEANKTIGEIEDVEERVRNFAYQPTSYRLSKAGDLDYRSIQNKVEEVLK